MQVSYKILVVIRTMKIKQQKNTVSFVCGVFYSIVRIDCVTCLIVCYTGNTQITNFSFQALVSHFFSSFFWTLPPFSS